MWGKEFRRFPLFCFPLEKKTKDDENVDDCRHTAGVGILWNRGDFQSPGDEQRGYMDWTWYECGPGVQGDMLCDGF